MERRRVGDGPDVLVRLCIGVGFGDCQKLPLGQVRNRRLKNGRVNIGVLGAAAIAGPPAGVDGKLQEICEPLTDFCRVDPRRRTAFQSAEFIEINLLRACAYQSQEPVDEGKCCQRAVSRISSAAKNLSISISLWGLVPIAPSAIGQLSSRRARSRGSRRSAKIYAYQLDTPWPF